MEMMSLSLLESFMVASVGSSECGMLNLSINYICCFDKVISIFILIVVSVSIVSRNYLSSKVVMSLYQCDYFLL